MLVVNGTYKWRMLVLFCFALGAIGLLTAQRVFASSCRDLWHNWSPDLMATKEKIIFTLPNWAYFEEYRIGKRKFRLDQMPGQSAKVLDRMQKRGSLSLAKSSDVVWLLPGSKLQYNCWVPLSFHSLKLRSTWRQPTLENGPALVLRLKNYQKLRLHVLAEISPEDLRRKKLPMKLS